MKEVLLEWKDEGPLVMDCATFVQVIARIICGLEYADDTSLFGPDDKCAINVGRGIMWEIKGVRYRTVSDDVSFVYLSASNSLYQGDWVYHFDQEVYTITLDGPKFMDLEEHRVGLTQGVIRDVQSDEYGFDVESKAHFVMHVEQDLAWCFQDELEKDRVVNRLRSRNQFVMIRVFREVLT